jgi:hypothetical protein
MCMLVSPRPICLYGVSEALRTRLCSSEISVEPPARTYATASARSSSGRERRRTAQSVAAANSSRRRPALLVFGARHAADDRVDVGTLALDFVCV